MGYVDWTMHQCRLEELPSPIEVPTDSSRVSNPGPSGTVANADVGMRQPASVAGSRLSQSSLLRKVALNEVRRAFFTSDSSSSLVDGASRSKTSVKDAEEAHAVQTSPSLEFSQPIALRLLLIL